MKISGWRQPETEPESSRLNEIKHKQQLCSECSGLYSEPELLIVSDYMIR